MTRYLQTLAMLAMLAMLGLAMLALMACAGCTVGARAVRSPRPAPIFGSDVWRRSSSANRYAT